MKSHPVRQCNKKGAIEMSMQTIIVVVIGITLLTLGLRFVYTTFAGITQQQKSVDEATKKQLRELFGESEDPVALVSNSIVIKQGESEDFPIGFRNVGTTEGDFSYKIVAEAGNPEKANWVAEGGDLGKLDVGGDIDELLSLDVPSDAVPGSYRFKIQLQCTADGCGDGKRFPFIIRVSA